MYTFVFLWTPALSPNGEKVAHGMIFACFMMSCMAGSTIAGRLLTDSKRYAVSHYMKVRLSFIAKVMPWKPPQGRCTCTCCRILPCALKPVIVSRSLAANCKKPMGVPHPRHPAAHHVQGFWTPV